MNLSRVVATLLASSIVVAGAMSSASAVEPNVLDSIETKSGDAANVAVDTHGVVWANSRWNPMVRTTKLERYRVSSTGRIAALRDVKIRGLNPLGVSTGRDGKLFIPDTFGDRLAVVTLSATSAVKKVRYITFGSDVTIFDASSDTSGKIYVLVSDGVYVLSKNARNANSPLLRIEAPFGGDDKSLTVTGAGVVYVADEELGAVYVFGPGDLEPIRTIKIDPVFAESGPRDLEIGPDGLLYVAYSEAGIASFNLTANGNSLTPVSWITASFGADFLDPQSIDFDANNHMIVGDFQGDDGIKVLGLPVG